MSSVAILLKMSVEREVSEKNRKFNSNLEKPVSCEVASNIHSKRVFISRGNTALNMTKYMGNTMEILGKQFEIIEG